MTKRITTDPKVPAKKNFCFGCGADNVDGMRLKFTYSKKGDCVIGRTRLAPRYAGPPGYCHGGIIATILDEAMAKLNKPRQILAMTGQMSVTYRRPVPLETNLKVEAREIRVSGRRRFREGRIVNQKGIVLAEATGVFITINPEKVFSKPRQ